MHLQRRCRDTGIGSAYMEVVLCPWENAAQGLVTHYVFKQIQVVKCFDTESRVFSLRVKVTHNLAITSMV
jgi:hypothetical protein